MEKIEVQLVQDEGKKRVVIYKALGVGWSMSVYIPKVLLEELGTPDKLTMTLAVPGK